MHLLIAMNIHQEVKWRNADRGTTYLIITINNVIKRNTKEINLPKQKQKRKEWITTGLIEPVNKRQ